MDKLLDDNIVPKVHIPGGRALTFGHPTDSKKDLECYAACLQDFLSTAIEIESEYHNESIYWYSDQVFEITKYEEKGAEEGTNYDSDGNEKPVFTEDLDLE